MADSLYMRTVDTYSTFAQQILAALLSQTTGNEAPAKDARTLKTCLAMLDLLAFRIARLRTISDSVKISTVPFETFVACHLAFRQALTSIREPSSFRSGAPRADLFPNSRRVGLSRD